MKFYQPITVVVLTLTLAFVQCKDDTEDNTPLLAALLVAASNSGCIGTTTSIDSALPDWIKNNFKCVTAVKSGDNVSITTLNLPNYSSYYWGSSSPYFEAMPSGNSPNPNTIKSQNLVFTIDLTPTANGGTTASGLGPVGVAINGVVIYNNQAAPPDTLTEELVTMDAGTGHPTNTGQYHYHTEPKKLTNDDAKLVGIMRDGFPIYGKREESGALATGLDAAHGHTHATTLFPSGIYHYHVTDADPYIMEVYRGTPGNLTQ